MVMTILVVDDSFTMVLSLRTGLSMNGFQVETANHGQAALDKLQTALKPNPILTDINRLVMGGMKLIGKVRALPGFPFIPILMLTTESKTSKCDEANAWEQPAGWLNPSLAMTG
jgi:two-component system, chemotaxis family, chemotaxis protein CheY